MTWWQYLLLVNLYLVLFYWFYVLLLRDETFFQLNRAYLVASALLSFIIPLIDSGWVRDLFITQKVQYTLFVYSSPILVYHFKPIDDRHITIGQLMLFIYASGAIVLAAKFIWQLVSLKKIINQPGASGAFSFFKSIRLGPNLDSRDVIAAHEQVHASQWHTADVLLIEAITIINWFNPIVYFYRLGIKHIHEFIADKQAIKSGTNKTEYALLLLSQTLKTPAHQLVNPFFNHSLLKRRIIMLQKSRSKSKALLKYGLSAPLFILMLILSSATISRSRTVKLFNNKAEEVFLTAASSLDSAHKDSSQIQAAELMEGTSDETSVKNEYTQKAPMDFDIVRTQKNEPVFTAVEKTPEFKGEITAFSNFLGQNLRYPEAMRKKNIQGKVYISFVVEKDGTLSNFHTLRGIGYGAEEESIRVLKLSPKWNPGYQNGRPVRVQFTIPISFTLENTNTAKNAALKIGDVEKKGSKNHYNLTNNTIYSQSSDTSKGYTTTFKNASNSQWKPLYLLDGKEIADISNVNPNYIESIDVLKQKPNDNSLEVLYGAKALNGVVIIKSKKSAQKPLTSH
jgi:TonB family protein